MTSAWDAAARSRYSGVSAKRRLQCRTYLFRLQTNSANVSFHPAGHVLGSAQILIETDQVPVEIERGRYRRDHLLFELQIGHFEVVLLHPDIAAIHRRAKSVQQILRQRQIDTAVSEWIQAEKTAVHS